MEDPSSIHTSESSSFTAMYHLQMQSQRTNCSISQNSSMNRLNQYEDSSNLVCDSADNCSTAGTSMNGVNVQISSGYWETESLVLPSPGALNRLKASTEGYGGEWNYNLHQQNTVENYDPTDGNRQKLDSFSDAFHGRGISRITNGGEQTGYNVHPNNSPYSHPFSSLSLPLVLSPPPTPLPPPSLSPPKRPAQSQNQTQSQSPSEGSLRFFAPPSCTSSILPGSFPPTHWLYLPTDGNGNTDITQQLSQETSLSPVYPEGVDINLRHLSTTATDTDTSSCSPLTLPPSIPKLEQEHDPVTSEHHMTWSQIMQTSQPFPPLHHSTAKAGELDVHEDPKQNSGFQQPRCLYLSSSQNTTSTVYTGVPFHSVLQSGVLEEYLEQPNHHYTPPPMLNPTRNGTGLFCNLLSPMDRDIWSEEIGHNACHRHVNIGSEFQAKIPDMLENDELHMCTDEPLHEELLWKPWIELEESDILLEHVENLLDLSTSAALPGSAGNLELALHSLSLCQGNILNALEIMLFSSSAPSRNYHYAGSDVWQLSEQKLFHKAFAMHGKDFIFIQKMVKTKKVSECVEFYYHIKWRQEKQRKQMEREQQQHMDAETLTNHVLIPASKITMNPISVERLIHTPSMAPSFPCKQCGKMFYKIKSRNAHMKIHRQHQEDWRERIHPNNSLKLAQALQNQTRTLTHPNQFIAQNYPNQMLTQNLIQNLVQSHSQLAIIQSNKTQSSCFPNSISNTSSTQTPQTASKTPNLPLYTGYQQTWGSLHGSLETGLYYD